MDFTTDRVRQWLGHRLVRAPEIIVRSTTGRRPIVVDGQRLDTRTQHGLAILARSGRPPLDQQSVDDARRDFARFPRVFEDAPCSIARVEDRTIPGPASQLPLRLYRPRKAIERRPVLVYFHGGGGVVGSIETHDGLCRMLARACDCLVVSVGYRLGPEQPFPAAPDDALAAFRWVAGHATQLGADATRIAVGGDSMGGNLAAVVCQLARDGGYERPCAQLLIYPSTDRVEKRRSRELFGDGFLLTESLLAWFVRHYLGGADPHDPRVSPLLHPDLRDLPPAVLATAGFDPLRDEGSAYADALREAGVSVDHRGYEGLIHGFAQMTGAVPAAHRAVEDTAGRLRALFDGAC